MARKKNILELVLEGTREEEAGKWCHLWWLFELWALKSQFWWMHSIHSLWENWSMSQGLLMMKLMPYGISVHTASYTSKPSCLFSKRTLAGRSQEHHLSQRVFAFREIVLFLSSLHSSRETNSVVFCWTFTINCFSWSPLPHWQVIN